MRRVGGRVVALEVVGPGFARDRRRTGIAPGEREGDSSMKILAAVCWEPRKPLEVTEIDLDGPKAGECLVRLAATGVCHTDAYTMSGKDPEGLFPVVLGHEGAGVVKTWDPASRPSRRVTT